MAKEFDIYLNNRLTQCDIIVYSIPYRDGLTVVNRVILESCLDNYLLQKFVAAQTGSELEAHIDKMIKICNEKLSVGTMIGVDAEFSTHYAISQEDAAIILGQNNVQMTAISFTDAKNDIVLDAEPLLALIGKSIGSGSSTIQLDQSVQKIIKNSIEKFENEMDLSARVSGTFKKNIIAANNKLVPMAELTNLCYRIHNAGETALQLAASVLGTEIHFSLGSGSSGMIIGASTDGGDAATKYETANNQLTILAELTETIMQFMSPKEAAVELAADVSAIIKRHRLLGEMDENALMSFDDMTLEDIDFIILQ